MNGREGTPEEIMVFEDKVIYRHGVGVPQSLFDIIDGRRSNAITKYVYAKWQDEKLKTAESFRELEACAVLRFQEEEILIESLQKRP
mgnify:CR=1 FL=1